MKYAVVYKRYSEVSKGVALVEETIEAADCSVPDGNLVFVDKDGVTLKAIPAGVWLSADAITADERPSSMIVGG